MELLGKAYEINLSFSLSDLLSLATICLTAWIALQTHRLQKRQTQLAEHQVNHELFPVRNEIRRTAMLLCLQVRLGFKPPLPDEALKQLTDYDFVSHHFNQSIADNIRRVLEYYYDQQDALGTPVGLMGNKPTGISLKKDKIRFEEIKQEAEQSVVALMESLEDYMKRAT